MRLTTLPLLLCLSFGLCAAERWQKLFNGRDLTGWQSVGDGIWTVLSDGTLVGQRNPRQSGPPEHWIEKQDYPKWLYRQAWLYTKQEYADFDLEFEYWLQTVGNSGVSLHDSSRAQHAVSNPPDRTRTPSRIGYEVQLSSRYPDEYPTGSIYGLVKAKIGSQVEDQWNRMRIQSRAGALRVSINGQVVAEHRGDSGRPKFGPIGLQLHDQYSVTMFRNIRLRTP
ncbi:MAG: DUF1080 domain-containing protein [Rhizobiales bacterium]|nr:DUF1080 domain-containing protein [Hyphomicrobiales bacterium]